MTASEFETTRARYAKGMMAVRCPSIDGMATRAARICQALNMRYSNREDAYIGSPNKVKRLSVLVRDGVEPELKFSGIHSAKWVLP